MSDSILTQNVANQLKNYRMDRRSKDNHIETRRSHNHLLQLIIEDLSIKEDL